MQAGSVRGEARVAGRPGGTRRDEDLTRRVQRPPPAKPTPQQSVDKAPRAPRAVRRRAGKARRRGNSSAIRPRSNAERSLGVAKRIANMTYCNLWFTASSGEAKRPARMHRRSNAGGILSTGCQQSLDKAPRAPRAARRRAGKARRRGNSSAIRPRSNAERSLGVAKRIANMTYCNLWFTASSGEAKRPARMHRRSNAGGSLSTGCQQSVDKAPRAPRAVRRRAGKARRRGNSSAIRPRSNAERSLGVAKRIANMTYCNLWFTASSGEAKRPARMHRRSNAGGACPRAC